MLFIHQQIQTFLNLGGCKEYPIMAKPKFPKKTNGVKETVPAASSLATPAETNFGPAEALAAASVTETPKAETRKAARKPEIVKTDPRANLVPINLEDEIRRFAYLLSERRGFEPGHEAENWLGARPDICQPYDTQRP